MRAMVLEQTGKPLTLQQLSVRPPESHQLLVKVMACGVCRTDLHIVDGELPDPRLPLTPGHEIIGRVIMKGSDVGKPDLNDVVGIPWLGYTCGRCKYCRNGQENLCDYAMFTGYTLNGGYAEYVLADARFCFPLTKEYAYAGAAPLLCAGLIGYRSYKLAGDHIAKLGIYGFGAAGHILSQIAVAGGKKVFAFTKEGDLQGQQFARRLGAAWASDSSTPCPEKLDAAIIFAPVGSLVPKALKDLDKGGVLVCGGIHMSDIPSFPYHLLWEERVIRSVANLTRNDAREFLEFVKQIPVQTEIEIYPLHRANEALENLRAGKVRGAAVLVMD